MDHELITPTEIAPTVLPKPSARIITPVASYVHTAIIIAIMVGVGLMSAVAMRQSHAAQGPFATYLPTIIFQWLIFGLVWFGMRRRGVRISEVLGRSWRSFDDILMDLVFAGGFWLVAVSLLVALGFLFMSTKTGGLSTEIPSALRNLAPHGATEISLWVVLSCTAGFCEEFIFRGYLQRQFTALTQRTAAGIALSALIFFSGHLYEGTAKAILVGMLGVMFGVLAAWRKNLRPGIIAHVWHDIFAGLLLSLFTAGVSR